MTIPMIVLSALAIGAIAAAFWAMFREYQARRENQRTAEWTDRMLTVQSQAHRTSSNETFEDWAFSTDSQPHLQVVGGCDAAEGSASQVRPSSVGRPAARYVAAVDQALAQRS
jgi:hypothetical protein